MKMARADENDLKAALDVSRIIDDLDRGYMPGQDDEGVEFFDRDDADQCRRALAAILDAADQGSMFRVTLGMTVVLDPRNKVVDPDADTLEIHPDHERNAEDAARWRMLPAFFEEYQIDGLRLFRAIDAALAAAKPEDQR